MNRTWQDYYIFMEKEAKKWDEVQDQKEFAEQNVLTVSKPEDIEEFEEEEEPEDEEEEEVELPPISGISRTDVRILLVVRELIQRQAAQAERQRRAEDIRQVDKSLYEIKPGTIESYIHRILSVTDEPIHINWIIAHIEELGWQSTSKFHKYAQVYKALRDNNYMFMKVGPGLFRLTNGFRKTKPEKTARLPFRTRTPGLAKIKDLVIGVLNKYEDNRRFMPNQVHFLMKVSGFPCAYSSVYRAMQSDSFVREGGLYRLSDVVRKRPEKS